MLSATDPSTTLPQPCLPLLPSHYLRILIVSLRIGLGFCVFAAMVQVRDSITLHQPPAPAHYLRILIVSLRIGLDFCVFAAIVLVHVRACGLNPMPLDG